MMFVVRQHRACSLKNRSIIYYIYNIKLTLACLLINKRKIVATIINASLINNMYNNNKLNMLYMQTPIKLTLNYEGDS